MVGVAIIKDVHLWLTGPGHHKVHNRLIWMSNYNNINNNNYVGKYVLQCTDAFLPHCKFIWLD